MTNQKNQTHLRFLSDFQVYIRGVGECAEIDGASFG